MPLTITQTLAFCPQAREEARAWRRENGDHSLESLDTFEEGFEHGWKQCTRVLKLHDHQFADPQEGTLDMTKRTHHIAKDAKHLQAFLDDGTFVNSSRMAEAFSVSSSTVSSWLNSKSPTPRWTLLAAEGLRRRRRAEALTFYLIGLPTDKPDVAGTVRTVVESLGGKFHVSFSAD